MNAVVAGVAARRGGHLLHRLAAGACALIVLGLVAFTGGIGGLAASGVGLGSSTSAATLSAGSSAVVLPAGGADLSVAAIGALAEQAGFTGQGLVMAIAVALAESGGNPTATNYDSNGTDDRGVWQINSSHSQYSATCDYDPPCNAAAAFSISVGGTNWGPWVTYQHGTEIAFLPVAVSFAEGAGAPS